MTDYASLLNETQLQAVETRAQHVRIIAGAGSGKTRVLTYRIAYLIEEMGLDPSRILAVTFTNKAAAEMKERVGKIVPGAAPFLQVSTFHSFCARFLRKEARYLGYPASFTIFDDEDQGKLIKDIAVNFGYSKGDEIIKKAKNYIGAMKTKGLYPDDLASANPQQSKFHSEEQTQCLKIYRQYEIEKMKMLAFDFDDLILKTYAILRDFDEVHQRWAHMYDAILVDEYQDTNKAQYDLLRMISNPETALYVVGDPDQTIYTWRGARQEIILNFPKDYPDYQDIILDRNYRSTKAILDVSNHLIAHNKKRVPKNLFTKAEEGETVTAKRFETAEDEAKWVVSKICDIATDGLPFGEQRFDNITVLYRSSYMTRAIESELAANRVPYKIFGGLRFYQRKEVKDVFAYFRLLTNEKDDVSFERIINVPKRGIGESSIARIRQEAHDAGVSEYEYIQNIQDYPNTELTGRVINPLNLLLGQMEATKEKLSSNLEAYSGILRDFITDIGYLKFLQEDQNPDEDRVGNVNALFDDVNHYIQDHPESTFDEYLQNIALLTGQDDINGGNYVSLMTIHVAKGLEFDNVFIVCMNQGSFPSIRTQNENGMDGLEEERRLAYVAMTRAKKRLYVTCNSGWSYATNGKAIPSQFFSEAGLELASKSYKSSSAPWEKTGRNYGSSWKKVYDDSTTTFQDGNAISPFESKPKPTTTTAQANPQSNGIVDWKVGDIAHHEKFGDGVVVELISSSIIIIDFDSVGKKTLLGTHKLLSRKRSAGGLA